MTARQDLKLTVILSQFLHKVIILDRNEKACQGITLSQHYTLDALKRKKTLTMNELSHELSLAMSTLTRVVDILVRDKYVKRVPHKDDRRKVCVTLTEKGMKKARKLTDCTRYFWTSILKSIPDQEKKSMINHIKLLIQAMDDMDGHCIHKPGELSDS